MAPLFTRVFFLLCAGHFMAALGVIASVLLPIWLDGLGATRTEIGLALALVALGGLLSRPAVGWALDALGRKRVLYLGIACCALGIGGLGFVDRLGPFLYLCQLLWGVGVGAMFTGIFTFAADHIPEEHRTQGMAIFGVFGLLPLGLYGVVESLHIPPTLLHRVFWVIGALIATSFLFIWGVPEVPRSPETDPLSARAPLRVRLRALWAALMQPPLLPVWVADVLFASMFAVFLAFAAVTASARGMESPGHIWLSYAVFALGVRTVGSGMMRRLGPERVVMPALALYVIAIVICAFGTTPLAFIVAGAFAGAGHGYCFPVLASLVVSRATESVRGVSFAFYTGLWDFCLFAMRPLAGGVADRFGDRTMYGLLALSVLAGLVVLTLLEGSVARRDGAS